MNWEALAWAIDCEGHIGIKKRKKPFNYQAIVKIAMCDKEFPERMKEIFRCGTIHKRERAVNQRPLYTWVIQAQSEIEKILMNCLPFFILKGEKAKVMLDFLKYKSLPRRTHANGHFAPYPKEIWDKYEIYYQEIRNLTKDKRGIKEWLR
jgi:hypothetical protein